YMFKAKDGGNSPFPNIEFVPYKPIGGPKTIPQIDSGKSVPCPTAVLRNKQTVLECLTVQIDTGLQVMFFFKCLPLVVHGLLDTGYGIGPPTVRSAFPPIVYSTNNNIVFLPKSATVQIIITVVKNNIPNIISHFGGLNFGGCLPPPIALKVARVHF